MKELFNKSFSRRSFLAALGVGMGAAALDWEEIEALVSTVEDKSEYPVVVIGSGLGGLTAAAFLARKGFPVTVLEQRDVVGGYATAFERAAGAYTFEVSLHWCLGMARFLEEFGIKDKVELIKLPEISRVILPDYDFIWPQQNPKEIARILSEKFPQEAEGIRSFMKLLADYAQEYMKPIDVKSISTTHPILWEMRNKTTAQVLDRFFKDQKLKAVFTLFGGGFGLPPSKLPANSYLLLTFPAILVGRDYIKPRSRALSDALRQIIEHHGGRVIFNHEVENILIQDGAVTGVKTTRGKTYAAKAVFSNASGPTTFGKMLPQDVLPESFRAKLQTYRPSGSSFIVWLGLKQEIRGKIQGYDILVSDGYDTEAAHEASLAADALKAGLNILVYDNLYPGYSKPGKSSVTLFMGCGYAPWKKFEEDYFAGRKETYQKEKDRITQILIDRAESRVIPGLRSMIEVMDAATPLTNVRYTRNPYGAIVGYQGSLDNSGFNRIKNRTPVKGLYLASAWGNPGGGYILAVRGGQSAFKDLTEDWTKITG
jgi:prolycopene isomerase